MVLAIVEQADNSNSNIYAGSLPLIVQDDLLILVAFLAVFLVIVDLYILVRQGAVSRENLYEYIRLKRRSIYYL